jgi:O-acetylserine/cysteine efflux transporter
MRFGDMLLAVLAVTIWGGNFVAAKIALGHFPPLLLTAVRFSIVALLLVPFVKRPGKADLKRIFALSVTLGVAHFSLVFGSLYVGLSVMASILVAQLGTPFTCVLAWFIFGDRMNGLSIFALGLAFLGVAIIAGTPDVISHFTGFIMALLGGFAWAATTLILKRIEERNIFAVLGWMGVFCVPQLLLLSFMFERHHLQILQTIPPASLVALSYTVLFSTFVAYGLWYHLLRKYLVSQVAPFALLTPVAGIFISRFWYDDPLTLSLLAGGALTLMGVALTMVRRPPYPGTAE